MVKKSTVEMINTVANILMLLTLVAGIWIGYNKATEISISLRDISGKSLVLQKAAPAGTNETPGPSVYTNDEGDTVILLEDEGDEGCIALGCGKGTNYVGSRNSDKYHRCSCMWAMEISKQNILCFKTPEEAESEGYVPCNVCKP